MNILAKKSLGQNFLINEGVIGKIITAAELESHDTVIEVGPGTGNLTKHLVGKVARLILIEKDHRLIEDLKAQSGSVAGVEVIEDDILKFNPIPHKLSAGGYKLIANLPYYITSRFFKTVLETWPRPERMVVMVQKEVAQRIMAQPPDMNLLGLSVQLYAKPTLIMRVSAGSFRPMPDVDSAVLCLTPHLQPLTTAPREKMFFTLAKAAFAGKRKKLSNTLGALVPESSFFAAGIDPASRPQHLTLEQWLALARTLEEKS